jgi:hypothetical protein
MKVIFQDQTFIRDYLDHINLIYGLTHFKSCKILWNTAHGILKILGVSPI